MEQGDGEWLGYRWGDADTRSDLTARAPAGAGGRLGGNGTRGLWGRALAFTVGNAEPPGREPNADEATDRGSIAHA